MPTQTQTLTITTTGVAQLFPYIPRLNKPIRFTVLPTNKNSVYLGPPGSGGRLYPSNPTADCYVYSAVNGVPTDNLIYRDEICKRIQQKYEGLDLFLTGHAGDGVTYSIYGGDT